MSRSIPVVASTLVLICGCLSSCGPSSPNAYGLRDGDIGDDLSALDDGGSDGGSDDGGGLGDLHLQTGDGGCGLRTCQSAAANCGPIGDGCGGVILCGPCVAPQICGGGGVPSQCGGSLCVPRTCGMANADCGPVADGCGGLLDCGKCAKPGESCGGGGHPSRCGVAGSSDAGDGCVPRTCQMENANCGPMGDGCGNQIDCGKCMKQGDSCGGGGQPSQCGSNAMNCVPMTCPKQGANCGPVADGCGGMLDCGKCVAPDICGGGGVPSVCGGGGTDAGVPCVNLCMRQMVCMNGTTTLSGTVVAPTPPKFGQPDPLYNVLVYIPNAAVLPFTPGVSCNKCGADASGEPLVSAITGPDGKFQLTNVPVGKNIPLVIQLGRWRRQIIIPNIAPCVDTALSLDQTRLPRNKAEGDIPLMAMVTGNVDALECVLRKIGIDEPEFSVPGQNGGNGRVQFYIANGADVGNGAPDESQLWGDAKELAKFDMVLFACEGDQFDEAAKDQQRVIDYASVGGRVYATHFSYVWLYDDAPFSSTANWDVNQTEPTFNDGPLASIVDQTFPKGKAFATWLGIVGAQTGPGKLNINVPRHDLDGVKASGQRWIYSPNPATIQHYTFNTPVAAPADQQCGRVLFSDFHVNDAVTGGLVFPDECDNNPMTAQEKVLEFMLFDLASCIQPDMPPPPMCSKRTCQQAKANCGPVGDGCGGLLDCGPCTPPQTCGGGGIPSQCGGLGCMAKTCMQLNIGCGPAGDGCGNAIDCSKCPPGQVCGGGGKPGQCGAGQCTPITCQQMNIQCGPAGDGCGNAIDCGKCPPGQTCGGGGKPGQCGASACVPRTCLEANANCGKIGDGCGGVVDCGPCPMGQSCGGGGIANQCGGVG